MYHGYCERGLIRQRPNGLRMAPPYWRGLLIVAYLSRRRLGAPILFTARIGYTSEDALV